MSDKIITAVGDRHNGKSVELIIDGEKKYLLKPKSADVQSAFEAFLAQLSREGFPFVPQCEKIFETGEEYYKTEFIENLPAASQNDVTEYYRKCGSLIFIAYMLSSTDLHCENIIACKNSPVLIDVENILSGKISRPVKTDWKNLADSVIASTLLPNWAFNGTEKIQCGGLCSDDISSPSTLKFNNAVAHIYDYVDYVIDGFASAYSFVLGNKALIVNSLTAFSDCKFRVLLRQTETYAKIIRGIAKTPDSEKHSFAAKMLEYAYAKDFRKNRLDYMRKVCNVEIDSVLKDDIPYFYVKGNGIDLCANGMELAEKFFSESPIACAEKKIISLSHDDLNAQIKIIKQSLASLRPASLKKQIISNTDDVCEIIYKKLEANCIPTLSTGWIMLESLPNSSYIKSIDNGLYDGLTGILCAYAALYYKTKQNVYLNSLLEHYMPLSDYIRNRKYNIPLKAKYVSLQNGAAGLMQSLLHIYELTGEELFHEDAVKIAELISTDAQADNGDILGGTAGLALCLPKLPKDISIPIAEKLITSVSQFSTELTGMAHGMAGVALALAALQNVLGVTAYDEKIIELLEKENSCFFAEHKNWRDLRYPDSIEFMNGWCSGAPGIGMSRKKIMRFTLNKSIAEICANDIEKVKENLNSDIVLKRDSLCCGNSSRLMACSMLGIKNDRLFIHLTDKIKNDTLNLLSFNDSCMENYSLMQGLSGVGYALAMYNDERSGGMLI